MAFGQDDISIRKGNYEVFFSTFNTSFLSPETAKAVGVVRAKDLGMLNISIREHFADGQTQSLKAKDIRGAAFDLIHKNSLVFNEVIEPGAVYYLAKFKISNDDEIIVIKVTVVPVGSEQEIDIEFNRRFYLN